MPSLRLRAAESQRLYEFFYRLVQMPIAKEAHTVAYSSPQHILAMKIVCVHYWMQVQMSILAEHMALPYRQLLDTAIRRWFRCCWLLALM